MSVEYVGPRSIGVPLLPLEQVRVYAGGMDHPEGVTVGLDGLVYAGGEAGQFYRLPGEGLAPELLGVSEGGFILGVALDAQGRAHGCDALQQAVMRVDGKGPPSRYGWLPAEDPIAGCNHCAFDSRGSLYVSDSGHWPIPDGRLLRVPPGGGVADIWCDELRTLPNGVCVGPGEEHLYVAMSFGPGRIDRVAIRPDGRAGEVETYLDLGDLVPDGLAFAENGDLYVVTYRPDAVFVIRAGSRRLELVAEDPTGTVLASPTNLAFGTLAGDPVLFCANIGRWHIAVLPLGVPGLPLAYPDLP
jgi:gluconolactonase